MVLRELYMDEYGNPIPDQVYEEVEEEGLAENAENEENAIPLNGKQVLKKFYRILYLLTCSWWEFCTEFIISLYDLTLSPDCSNPHACKPELARVAISARYCNLQEGGVLRHLEK